MKISTTGDKHRCTDSKSWVNPNRITSKKYVRRHNINKPPKTKGKEKYLERSYREIPINHKGQSQLRDTVLKKIFYAVEKERS